MTLTKLPKLLFTTAEVCEMTGLTERKIWQLCKEGRLEHQRIDQQYRFTMGQIEALLVATVVRAEAPASLLAEMRPIRRRPRALPQPSTCERTC